MNDFNIAPVMGASQLPDTSGPWAGYPREALFAEARAIRDAEGISFTRAICRVVIAYEKARRERTQNDGINADAYWGECCKIGSHTRDPRTDLWHCDGCGAVVPPPPAEEARVTA